MVDDVERRGQMSEDGQAILEAGSFRDYLAAIPNLKHLELTSEVLYDWKFAIGNTHWHQLNSLRMFEFTVDIGPFLSFFARHGASLGILFLGSIMIERTQRHVTLSDIFKRMRGYLSL